MVGSTVIGTLHIMLTAPKMSRRAARRANVMLLAAMLLPWACGGKKAESPPPPPPPPENPAEESLDPSSAGSRRETATLEQAQEKIDNLLKRLAELEAELASLEERHLALEAEHAATLEEVLRSKASVRGIQSRAFATSRIAEVRVQLQSVAASQDPEIADRLRRAGELLDRADVALSESNYGGAAYLAELAGELTRQANLVSEFRSSPTNQLQELIPIVPPRSLEAAVTANLRQGPGTDSPRIGLLSKGQKVTAVARLGSWFKVVTPSGEEAWLHRSVVR
jgi:hypothetical protein